MTGIVDPGVEKPRGSRRQAALRVQRSTAISAAIALAVLAVAGPSQAVSTAFSYQGQIQIDGSPANGACDLQFSLFPVASGGSQVGSTLTQDDVILTGGVFTLQLDFGAAFDGTDRFLQLGARCPAGTGSFTAVGPRQRITATPYALFSATVADGAITSAKLGSAVVGSTQLQDGSVTLAKLADGTVAAADVGFNYADSASKGGPATNLACSGCVTPNELSPTGSTSGQVLTSNGESVSWQSQTLALPVAQSGTNAGGLLAITNTTDASTAHALDGYAPSGGDGILGQSDRNDGNGVRGINTGAAGIGVVGVSEHPATAVPYANAAGSGVFGYTNKGRQGVFGQSDAADGSGVRGVATGATGKAVLGVDAPIGTPIPDPITGIGVFGYTKSGQYGVYGESDANFGIGVGGLSASGYGVQGESSGGEGVSGYGLIGVHGHSPTPLDRASLRPGYQPPAGVRGDDPDGVGVFGQSSSAYGVLGCGSPNGCAFPANAPLSAGVVAGYTQGAGTPTQPISLGEAVYLATPDEAARFFGPVSIEDEIGGTADYLLIVAGNILVKGNIAATGNKQFVIDHPLDPANKLLRHAAVESAEMKNLYDGIAVLDADGEAWVELPAWFEALNTDYRYQLTAIGAPAPTLYVAEEISNNRFKIGGGISGLKVSWQVSGLRNDAYAIAHPLQVEEDKAIADRGHLFESQAKQSAADRRAPGAAMAQGPTDQSARQ